MNFSKKAKLSVLTVLFVLVADQALKLWVKFNIAPGQTVHVFGNWFLLEYVENSGMAFGWALGGTYGKLLLSVFRIIASVLIIGYIRSLIKKNEPTGLIIAMSLILAGALGNIIDSAIYGVIFGYAPFLHGRVIDMLHFPLFSGTFPSWLPIWGNQSFDFFSFVFNLADSAITIGVSIILIFQKKFFAEK